MPQSNAVLALTPRQGEFLEDLLDLESERMRNARKPGAGPGRTEKLLNSISERVIVAGAVQMSRKGYVLTQHSPCTDLNGPLDGLQLKHRMFQVDIALIRLQPNGSTRMADAAGRHHPVTGIQPHGERKFRADPAFRRLGIDLGAGLGA
jgi:hypothetical protein